MGTLVLIFLFSCPAIALCYCHVKAKMKPMNQRREPSLIHLSFQDDSRDLRVQDPEYEEIQATRNASSSTFSAPGLIVDYSLTLCPAYGQVSQESRAGTVVNFPSFPPHTSSRPQAPEYEDIHELQVARNTNPSTSSPSGVPDLATAYTFTRCPAYEQVPQDSGVEFETVAEISSLPPCAPSQQRVPEYEDIHELQATKNADHSHSGALDLTAYRFNKGPTYGNVPEHAGREAVDPSHIDVPTDPEAHEYEDIKMVQTKKEDMPYASPDIMADYVFTQCPAL